MRINNSIGNEMVIETLENGDIFYSEYNKQGDIILNVCKNIQTVYEYDSRGFTKIMQRDLNKLKEYYFNKIIVKRRFSEELQGCLVYGDGDGISEISFRGDTYFCYRSTAALGEFDSNVIENIEELKRVSSLVMGSSDEWKEVYRFQFDKIEYSFYEMKLENGEFVRFFCDKWQQNSDWEFEEFEEEEAEAVC